MKTLLFAFILTLAACGTTCADVYVRPHVRGNGTIVQGHYRSDPDGIRWNNWSSRGNVNPYTGKAGTRSW